MPEQQPSTSSFTKRPSLLIGVGGTGLRIARMIHAELMQHDTANHARVAVLGFDTSEEDIKKVDADFPVVQISSNNTVWQALESLAGDDGRKENWPESEAIPYDIQTKNLIDGAGQVRMVSALALYERLKNAGAFSNELRQIQTRLFGSAAHPEAPDYDGSLDVLVVGSLAGGTGSGILLPVSLLIRDWLAEMGAEATVRGLALLPNIYIGGGLPAKQNDNVRANAYAAMRELHAAMQAITGRTGKDYRFHYAPGKKLEVWDRSGRPEDRPLHSIVLMDGYGEGGRPLPGGIENYERMAAACAFQLLFTPLGVRVAAIHDNNVRDAIAHAAEHRTAAYAAMGMSAIVYPQQEVEDYLALKFAETTLSDEWLRLDRLFVQAFRDYEKRKRRGDTSAVKPERGSHYVSMLDDLAAQYKRSLFDTIHKEIHSIKKGVLSHDEEKYGNVAIYLDSLKDHLLAAFWDDRGIKVLTNQADRLLTEDDWRDSTLGDVVRQRDRLLNQVQDKLNLRLQEQPRDQFQALWIAGEAGARENYHVQRWLYDGSAHPVKARYFLYALKALIGERREKAKNYLDRAEGKLDRLSRRFDDPDTPDVIETALDKATGLDDENWFKRTVMGRAKEFRQSYTDYYAAMMSAMKDFGEKKALLQIYEQLDTQVKRLIEKFEQLFDSLERLHSKLGEEVDANEVKRDIGRVSGDASVYVLSDSVAKRALWDELKTRLSGEQTGEAINKALIEGVYEAYAKASEPRGRFDPEPPAFDGGSLFREQVVDGYCRDKLKESCAGSYQKNIAQAIRADAALRNEVPDKHLDRLAERVTDQASPYLQTHAPADNDLRLWAVHPKVVEGLGGKDITQTTLARGDGSTSYLDDPVFDARELRCFHLQLNLTVENLTQFGENGDYARAYRQIHDQLLREENDPGREAPGVLTHHVHKDWHRPGVLPEFSIAEERKLEENTQRAWIAGWALGRFTLQSEDGERRVYLGNRLLVRSDINQDCIKALMPHPVMREGILDVWNTTDSSGRLEGLLKPELIYRVLYLQLEGYPEADLAVKVLLDLAEKLVRDSRSHKTEEANRNYYRDELNKAMKALNQYGPYAQLLARQKTDFTSPLEQGLQDMLKRWDEEIIQLRQQGR